MGSMTMNESIDFSWSDKKYGIREFAELFYDRLPLIGKIEEQIYEDDDTTKGSSSPSVCFIHSVHLQSRVVARTKNADHYVTIPKKYPFKFHTIKDDGSMTEPSSVVEIVKRLSTEQSGEVQIQMAQTDMLTITETVDCNIFGPLYVTGTYNEKYLLTVPLDAKGSVDGFPAVTAVPLYMPLEVCLPAGVSGCVFNDLGELEEHLKASVSTASYEGNAEELLIFSHPPNDDEYEFVFPSKFASLNDLDNRTVSSNSSDSESVSERNENAPPKLPNRVQEVIRTDIRLRPLRPLPNPDKTQGFTDTLDSKNFYELEKTEDENIYEDFTPRFSLNVQDNCKKTEEEDTEKENQYESYMEISKMSIAEDSHETQDVTQTDESCNVLSANISCPEGEEVDDLQQQSMTQAQGSPEGSKVTGYPVLRKSVASNISSGSEMSPISPASAGIFGSMLTVNFSDSSSCSSRGSSNNGKVKDQKSTKHQATSDKKSTGGSKSSWNIFRFKKRSVDKGIGKGGEKSNPINTDKSPADKRYLITTKSEEVKTSAMIVDAHGNSRFSHDVKSSQRNCLYYDSDPSVGSHAASFGSSWNDPNDKQMTDKQTTVMAATMSRFRDSVGTGISGRSSSGDGLIFKNREKKSKVLKKQQQINANHSFDFYEDGNQRILENSQPGESQGKNSFGTTPEAPRFRPKSYQDHGIASNCNGQHSSATANVRSVTDLPPIESKQRPSIDSLNDVPSNVSSLSVNGVADCLRLLNLRQYVDRFVNGHVDGELLICLDIDLLMQEFGLTKFDALKLAKFALDGWRPNLK